MKMNSKESPGENCLKQGDLEAYSEEEDCQIISAMALKYFESLSSICNYSIIFIKYQERLWAMDYRENINFSRTI